MKTLKNDQVDLFKYATIIDVIENVPEFLEDVNNKKTTAFIFKLFKP